LIAAVAAGVAAWCAVAVGAPRLAHRMPPATATRLLVLAAGSVTACSLVVPGMIAFLWLARLPEVIEIGPWSEAALRDRTPVPPAVALGCACWVLFRAGCVAAAAIRQLWAVRAVRAESASPSVSDALLVLDTERPMAFSTPPPGGRIVVSTGLWNQLTPAEQQVIMAHEMAHLRHGHTWWVLAVDVCVAGNPLLRPLSTAVAQAVERWADEDAAVHLADRRLVARTIARAALLTRGASPAVALGAAAGNVPGRVKALLAGPPRPRPIVVAALLTPLLAATLAAVVVQRQTDAILDRAQLDRPVATAVHRHPAQQQPVAAPPS
jgi:Zn-dependent protease with chaperone function